ncbi:MAG: hypothetical protein ACYDHE_19710 [Candidatus Acidiferrales bacterium]
MQNTSGLTDAEALSKFGKHAEHNFGPNKASRDKLTGRQKIGD